MMGCSATESGNCPRANGSAREGTSDRTEGHMDSFGAATELQVGDRPYAMYRLAALERHGFGSRACPIRCASCWKTCCVTRTAPPSPGTTSRRSRAGNRLVRTHRDRVSACPRSAAGFHRRARDRRSRGDARRHGPARRRPRQNQSATAGRAGHRPFDPGRRLRRPRGAWRSTRELDYAPQQRALRVPQMGPAGLREFPRGAAEQRHLPPGQHRISGAGRVRSGGKFERRPEAHSPIRTRWWGPTRIRRW